MSDPRDGLPPKRSESLLSAIDRLACESQRCVVVLDDDPTGTQTVYQTSVLTTWDEESLVDQLRRNESLFYILTNSRALPRAQAVSLAAQIGRNLVKAASLVGRELSVISRSDSTLRGHYPAEVRSLAKSMNLVDAIDVIMPFFLQGGRLTINDVHYVLEETRLVPAAETAFAKDATFGFKHSNLREWIVEKCGPDAAPSEIHSVSIEKLRTCELEAIAEELCDLPGGSAVIVNAVEIEDAHAFAYAARVAETRGAKLMYRTAASFVQAYGGLAQQPLLGTFQMVTARHRAGLIVVGSYVPKTSQQLKALLEQKRSPVSVVLDVQSLLGSSPESYLRQIAHQVGQSLRCGEDVVLSTSRELVTANHAEANLAIGSNVSNALVEIVRSIDVELRFLIAKGGITSSDVATKALGVRRANVLGQILPGIPVWSLGPGSRFPKMPYVVFPGNVGGIDALAAAYELLRAN